MSMKAAQEAKKGDRVWRIQWHGKGLRCGVVDIYRGSTERVWAEIGGEKFMCPISEFGTTWGYLADNETVIGGQMIRNPKPGLWYLGIGSYWDDAILENRKAFDDWCKTLNLSEADKAAIQDHVRKHSAAGKPKRIADDVKVGDFVIVQYGSDKPKRCKVIHIDLSAKHDQYVTEYELHGDHYWKPKMTLSKSLYGVVWRLEEDGPQAQEAKPADELQAQPAPEQPSPQFGNVKLLIKAKGLEWVKANIPDAYAAYQAHREAGIRASKEAYDKLAKPGILAGKFASPY